MIYEMFKALAVDGLGWWEFAWAVVVTVLLVHLLSWAAGVAACEGYKYVQDKEETIENFMWTIWGKVWKVVEEPISLEGWYKTSDLGVSTLYEYWCFERNECTDRADCRAHKCKQIPKGFTGVTGIKSKRFLRKEHILYGTPFYVAATFLIFDALPVLVISVATVYATLRLTRTVVRISKRVTKVEEVTTVPMTKEEANDMEGSS